MYKNTKENGITLVALVITIIILLILAGVTISYISGGIIDKTKLAINDYENADKRQQEEIDKINEYNKDEIDLEPVYSEEGAEDNIAPAELFKYEIINDGSIASTYMQNLPTKTARIIGMNPEYCNASRYDSFKGDYLSWDVQDTNYKIIYNGNTIEDVLIIPYQVELDENGNVTEDGEMYKITEVDLSIISGDGTYYYIGSDDGNTYDRVYKNYGSIMPDVKKIIYPNTVDKLLSLKNYTTGYISVQTPDEIVLSKNMESVSGEFVQDLINIKIPTGITTIDAWAFSSCSRMKQVVIPKSIQYIDECAFYYWNSDQTIYFECSEEDSKNWNPNWNEHCDAKIVWNYNSNEVTE